jgi:hypothetical protein
MTTRRRKLEFCLPFAAELPAGLLYVYENSTNRILLFWGGDLVVLMSAVRLRYAAERPKRSSSA